MSEFKRACTASPNPVCLPTKNCPKYLNKPTSNKLSTLHASWHITPVQTSFFPLVVDDFRVKYTGQQDADFLCKTLTNAGYEITTNWNGTLFCDITFRWDCLNHKCYLSMPGYVKAALCRFHHDTPLHPKFLPADHTPISYRAKIQQPITPSNSPYFDAQGV